MSFNQSDKKYHVKPDQDLIKRDENKSSDFELVLSCPTGIINVDVCLNKVVFKIRPINHKRGISDKSWPDVSSS